MCAVCLQVSNSNHSRAILLTTRMHAKRQWVDDTAHIKWIPNNCVLTPLPCAYLWKWHFYFLTCFPSLCSRMLKSGMRVLWCLLEWVIFSLFWWHNTELRNLLLTIDLQHVQLYTRNRDRLELKIVVRLSGTFFREGMVWWRFLTVD